MVNVNIVDTQESDNELLIKAKEYIQDQGFTTLTSLTRYMMEHTEAGYHRSRNIGKQAFKELGIPLLKRGEHSTAPKYYSKNHGKYRIAKTINRKCIQFCYVKDERTARSCVQRLKLVNWDKKEMPRIKEELKKEGYNI